MKNEMTNYNEGFRIGQLMFAAELVKEGKLDITYACNKLNILKESFEVVLKNINTPDKAVMSDIILIPVGGRPTKFTDELATELSAKYKTMLIPELAKEYGVSESTMFRWLKRAGLAKNKRNGE